MKTRKRIFRSLGAALVTLALAFAPADVARASISDCFEALVPLDKAAEAAKISGVAAACLSEANGDPIMAMTIAALTAAAISGAFSNSDECNQLIDSVVGQMIASALVKLPGIPDAVKAKLEQFAQGNAPVDMSMTDIIEQFLPQMKTYIACGCNVAGLPGDFANLAAEYAGSVEGCANFFGDAADSFFGMLGDAACSAFCGHDFVPGIQMEADPCYKYIMPADIWTASHIRIPSEWYCNQYICPAGLLIVEKTSASGQPLYKCSAKCPETEYWFDSACVGDSCRYGTTEWTANNGRCNPGGSVQFCEPGEKLVKWGDCEPACSIGEYFDPKTKKCSDCPPGQTNALTKCQTCPPNQIIWSFDQASKSKSQAQIGAGGTPPAQVAPPNAVTRAPTPGSPPPSESANRNAPASRAPSAVTANPSGVLIATEPGKCVPCPQNWIPRYDTDPIKSSLGHCEECPPGSRANLNQCQPLNCRGGYDPKNPHTCLPVYQAVPGAPVIPGDRPPSSSRPGANIVPVIPPRTVCPPGTQPIGGKCVPVRRTPPQALRPAPSCPPGMVPNPRGPGCVRSAPAVAPPPNLQQQRAPRIQ